MPRTDAGDFQRLRCVASSFYLYSHLKDNVFLCKVIGHIILMTECIRERNDLLLQYKEVAA